MGYCYTRFRNLFRQNNSTKEMKIFTMKYTAMALLGLTIASCSTVPLSGRKQLALVSDDQIQEQATTAYKEFLGSPKTKVITGTSNAALVKSG